jgi:hypothetical protein
VSFRPVSSAECRGAVCTEGVGVDDVEDEDEEVGAGVGQVPEPIKSFLSGCVPQMQHRLERDDYIVRNKLECFNSLV